MAVRPEQEPVPEADAQEQARPLAETEGEEEIDEFPPEVPEADALEQARPLAEGGTDRKRLPADVPEADALDQERPAAEDDDDDWR